MLRNRFMLPTLILFLFLGLVPTLAVAEALDYEVDPVHSNISFKVRHFVTKVEGIFTDFSGKIHHNPDNVKKSKVEFTIQAKSIETNNDRRDTHLRSADFFDVEKFPTLAFKSTNVKANGENKLDVTGQLTIHGVTKEVTVPVSYLGNFKLPDGSVKGGFETAFTIDRTDYEMVWNRVLDQGTILGDEVTIEISVEANKAE